MQVRIKGYSFELAEPYQPGHSISLAEAQQLNGLRAENINNNLRRLVADATASLQPGELLDAAALSEIQARISRYDAGYQFLERHEPRVRMGDLEAEARSLAEARVDAEARAADRELTEAEREALVASMELLPAIVEEARLVLGARRKALAQGLDSL